MLEIATQRGVPSEQALTGTRLTPAMLQRPDLRIPARAGAALTRNVVKLTGIAGIGFEFGLHIKPNSHGMLGYAAMSCATLGEASELMRRHMRLRFSDFALHPHREGSMVVVDVLETHDLGQLRHMLYEGLMTIAYQHAGSLIGERLEGCELHFEWPEPAYAADYRDRLPMLRFGQHANQFRLPAHYLNRPLPMADVGAAKQAMEQVLREQASLGNKDEDFMLRVRSELVAGLYGYPNLDDLAAKLFMSGRTLKRKLKANGTSFQALLDETRRREATRLMENPDINLQTIATALGYTDPACFTRAFKRWTGHPPSHFRNLQNR
jgi:AraC-like DNA-binding protein